MSMQSSTIKLLTSSAKKHQQKQTGSDEYAEITFLKEKKNYFDYQNLFG